MSDSQTTFLVEDPRISKIANDLPIAVKDGPASSNITAYRWNSNASNSTQWNINVPSENTLIDKRLTVRTKITVNATFTQVAGQATTVSCVPSAFPLNQILQSASLTVNNSKVTVQTSDILNVLTKQYSQQYLSKNLQQTPNYVDKYYGLASDAYVNKQNASSYWGNFSNAEKDTDTMGRGGASGCTIRLYGGAIAAGGVDVLHNNYEIPNGAPDAGVYTIQCVFDVEEPLFGLPTTTLQENEASYIGVKRLELMLQYGELSNLINAVVQRNGVDLDLAFNSGISAASGAAATTTVLSDDSTLVCKYMSLHASQYAKLSKRQIIAFDEFVVYNTTQTRTSDLAYVINSNEISLGQIPDKVYITVRPQPSNQKPRYSNNLTFGISGLNIKFNGVAGLLTDMTTRDLYVMSRRNGSNQTWSEFSGTVKISNADGTLQSDAVSCGPIIVIDVSRDLGLSDMLSSSSLGSFSMSVTANVNPINGVGFADVPNVELDVMVNNAGAMIIEAGSSQVISGMLTKEAVLETKARGSSNVDYEDLEKLAGGNIMKQGKSAIGQVMKKERARVARKLDANVDKGVDYGAERSKKYAHDKLSKYI